MGVQVRINGANLSFPHLFERHAAVEGGRATYQCELILDASNPAVQLLDEASRKVALEKFGPERGPLMPSVAKRGEMVNQQKQMKGKPPRPEINGKVVISASDEHSVMLFDEHGKAYLNVDTDMGAAAWLRGMQAKLTPGCIVNAIVDVYAFAVPANSGITCGLRGIQFVRNTGPGVMDLGGAVPISKDAFGAVTETSASDLVGNPAIDNLF